MKKYKKLIEDCLKIASKGEGQVSPNPLVGAVLIDGDGNFISSGYHQKCGEAHAEVNAINAAEKNVKGATIAVNLEPCSHYGKTPPCADLIIKSGIKRVIIGMQDPNPKVDGGGIKKLQDAGIEVICGVLEDKCKKLNEIFITNQTKQKPFVAIKTATTADGKIATANGDSKWITCEKSRKYVHKLRNKYDAILTSSNTVLADNPQMTCRIKNGRNPIRVLVDRCLKTDFSSKIYENNGAKVFIAVDENIKKLPQTPNYIEFIKCPVVKGNLDLAFLLNKLFEKGIMSILVEAGGTFNGALLKTGMVDKIYHFYAPKILGDNRAISFVSGFSPQKIKKSLQYKIGSLKKFENDIMVEYYPA